VEKSVSVWALENRGSLVAATLTLGRAWIDAGAPRWSGAPLGSFERWCDVIGGVLEVVGVRGFLGDRPALQPADPGLALVALFERWWRQHGDGTFGVKLLLPLVSQPPPLELGLGDEAGASSRLGQLLRRAQGGTIGSWTLEAAGKYQGAQQYRIRPSTSATPTSATGQKPWP
jgi:putative DNA primase/helicase